MSVETIDNSILPDGGRQIDALTSLRFFAAFYVLILHSGSHAVVAAVQAPGIVSNFLANGYLGVNFFFVLSGFILAYIYQGRLRGSYLSYSTSNYAIARFARVYPVYVLALLLTIPVVPWGHSWNTLPQFLLLQCWLPPAASDVYTLGNDNGPAWTLSIELFFYLAFPVLIKWAERLRTPQIFWVIAGICCLMVWFRLPAMGAGREGWQVPYRWQAYVPLPISRTPEFLYGVLLGILFRRGILPVRPLSLYLAGALTFATLCCSILPWVPAAATILFGLVIILTAVNHSATIHAPFLESRFLVLLGGACYSIYLLQYPVHRWLRVVLGSELEPVAKTIYVPVLIIISIVVFLRYEIPLREFLRGKIGASIAECRWACAARWAALP